MGPEALFFTLAALSIASCQTDINVTDFIFWKKEDIVRWNIFFPRRYLATESLTNVAAKYATNSLGNGLKESFEKVLAFPINELETAKQAMTGTNAEGCIYGISNYLDKTIQEQVEAYEDCAADTPSKLSRLNSNLVRINTTYQAAYQRALAGIDACYKTYPNKDSIDRLRSCVESMNNNYFAAADYTQKSLTPSPSMTYFQDTVIKCASTSVQAVSAKGVQFLKMLVSCAALSGTVDPADYAHDLGQWKGLNDTLANQISLSQGNFYKEMVDLERTMEDYYNMQKQAFEQYVIESRGMDFYMKKVFSYLNYYYNTVTMTLMDNPGDSDCVTDAKNALDTAANFGYTTSLKCDQAKVDDTRRSLNEVYTTFYRFNDRIAEVGNVAILDCMSHGCIYAPNTVRECFLLSLNNFKIDYAENYQNISINVKRISNYIDNFFGSTELPCGGLVFQRMFLRADEALYSLKRCLYESSGTTYDVTTPPTTTTSSTPA